MQRGKPSLVDEIAAFPGVDALVASVFEFFFFFCSRWTSGSLTLSGPVFLLRLWQFFSTSSSWDHTIHISSTTTLVTYSLLILLRVDAIDSCSAVDYRIFFSTSTRSAISLSLLVLRIIAVLPRVSLGQCDSANFWSFLASRNSL